MAVVNSCEVHCGPRLLIDVSFALPAGMPLLQGRPAKGPGQGHGSLPGPAACGAPIRLRAAPGASGGAAWGRLAAVP